MFVSFSSIGHQNTSTLDLTWCTSCIPMKQTLFIANVLSSYCGMYFFLDQIWVCVYFSWWYPATHTPLPPPDQKAIQATGKLIQEITKALVVYIWVNSKSAAFDPVTSELLPLYRAAKKNSRHGKTVLHPFKWIYYHETNV